MKKIIITLFALFYSFSASAEVGVNVGISGQIGVFEATAHEKEGPSGAIEKSAEEDAMAAFGYASIFVEKEFGVITLGVDYVPTALESESNEEKRTDRTGSSTDSAVTQKVQVDFEDLTTLYVAVNLNDSFYLKAGLATVDVITNENLGTGSTYGNTDLDGTIFGAGYNKDFDNGMFVRAEALYQEFDGVTVNGSGDTSISVDEINGASGKISIGKSF